ncbi:hypothetical protein HMPREF9413_4173 [Paenibacillus sp. HGF7]|nr:hypothetical protein HMPREF9413_4173 [Paenibacillus sp. HGF7]
MPTWPEYRSRLAKFLRKFPGTGRGVQNKSYLLHKISYPKQRKGVDEWVTVEE